MKTHPIKKALSLMLSLLMVATCFPLAVSAANESSAFTPTEDFYLISDTKYNLAPGITENRIITNKTSGTQQETVYAVTVDMSENSTAGVMAAYSNSADNLTWSMTSVRQQAQYAQQKTGNNIVAAFNADIYNMSTGEPTGTLVIDGRVHKSGLGRPYFGITKDGKPVMGDALTQDVLDNLQQGVGGFYMLIKDGQRTPIASIHEDYIAPHTAVGLKADGSLVLMCVDGRNYPISNSCDNYDLTTILLGLGCVEALNFDGGGSTTYLAKYEGSEALTLANHPSDSLERKVASSVLIYSNAAPSGVFDHASLLPNNEVYTPGSEVQFSATGVDASGGAAELPADGTFALADDTFGTIDPTTGLFTSNGKTGEVVVNYVSGGAVVGTISIDVQAPDFIGFSSEEVSLGFSKESTLGLTVKYQDRDVNYKADDIVFDLSDPALGSFEGLTFISSPTATVNGTVTASYVGNADVNGTVNLVIGRLPTVVLDFEDLEDEEGNVILAEDYYTFSKATSNPDGGFATLDDPTAKMAGTTYNRGGTGSTSIVDISSGEPVRFGNKALKVDFDFSQCGQVTEGFAVGPTIASEKVDGIPTGIGMWVYAPEGTPNLWVRVRVKDGSNTTANLDFNQQSKDGVHGGIDYQGWKYLEADLTNWTGPFSLMGGEMIRLMYVSGTNPPMGYYTKNEAGEWVSLPKANHKGTLYIDNVQFVYGANVDDVDNPIISSIQANLNEITNNMEVDSNTVSFRASYTDVQNTYTTGVDPSTVAIFIDGIEMTHKDNCFIMEGDEMIRLEDVELADGPHTVKVRVRDGFGNETIESRSFIVNGDKDYPAVSVVPVDEAPILGSDFTLALRSDDTANLETVSADVKIDSAFTDYTVSFADGFTGTAVFDSKTNTIKIEATGDGTATGEQIATITFAVPDNLDNGKAFTYAVTAGSATFGGDYGENFVGGFTSNQKSYAVETQYEVSFDPQVVGWDGVIYVKDKAGNPVSGATVNRLTAKSTGGYDSTVLGTTDADGKLVTNALTTSVQTFILQANVDTALTFKVSGQSTAAALAANGKPAYIMANASQKSATQQNITWLSNPVATDSSAVIMYAEKAAYEAKGSKAFSMDEGTSTLHQFLGSSNIDNNYVVRVNSVVLEDLKPGTEYIYKVGDGSTFSALNTFTTTREGEGTSFFVIGDAQAVESANFTTILNHLKEENKDFSFGIQTGDSIEVANIYGEWVDLLNMFSDEYLSTVDILHVFGNHEYMSDPEGTSAQLIYNVPDESHYSAEYGNVYVATISYTTDMDKLDAALEWLKEDAAKSDCQWKILTIHQPPYYTHTAGGNGPINERVPAAAEAAGIDIVFSGHDHSYARTKPIANGSVDEENGITYYICGSTGAKSYPVQNTGFDFEIATQDFNGIYLTVQTDDKQIEVVTHDLDGSIIDSFVKTKATECTENGHDYVYGTDGYLTCTVCGYTTPLDSTYTGFATDAATGRTRYFINGETQTGWLFHGEDVYYFDENGIAISGGKHTINDIEYEFTEDGRQAKVAFVVVPEGYTRGYWGDGYITGWKDIDGKTYHFIASETQPGKMLTGRVKIQNYNGQGIVYNFAADGHLLDYVWVEEEGGTRYYWAQTPQTGWVEIDGKQYYFDPGTAFMQTGVVTIDGETYSFGDDGALIHKGVHADENGDHLCDTCGDYIGEGPSFLYPVLRFFYSIIAKIRAFFQAAFAKITNPFGVQQ